MKLSRFWCCSDRPEPVASLDMPIHDFANARGYYTILAILGGEVCVKLVLGGQWTATAQYI